MEGGASITPKRVLAGTQPQAGASREELLPRLVPPRNGMETPTDGGMRGGRLADHLKADAEVTALLSPEQIDACFDEAYHLKHVDTIFRAGVRVELHPYPSLTAARA